MGFLSKLKTIIKVLWNAGKIKEYSQILETQEKLLKMQDQMELVEEENKRLKGALRNKEALVFRNGAYWKKENGDGPYCSLCLEKDKKLIRLTYTNPSRSRCPACDNSFPVKSDRY